MTIIRPVLILCASILICVTYVRSNFFTLAEARTGGDRTSADPPVKIIQLAQAAPGRLQDATEPAKGLVAGQWVALSNQILGNSKHISTAYNPDNQRLYATAGDHPGGSLTANTGLYQSYRQETYSLYLKNALLHPSNELADFRLEYPYCGPSNQVQPKHPDYTGWTWDSRRHVFWLVPGQHVAASTSNCAGETPNSSDDPFFLWGNHLMQFDPAGRKWTAAGPGLGPSDNWSAHYDPVKDELIRFIYDGGRGPFAQLYDIKSATWRGVHLSTGRAGDNIRFEKGVSSLDPNRRIIYAMDNLNCHLYSFDIATEQLNYLADCPAPREVAGISQSNVVWDQAHGVLIYGYTLDGPPYSAFYAFHPDTKIWEKLPNKSQNRNLYVVNASAMA